MKRWTRDKGWHDSDIHAVYEPGLGWARRDGVVSVPNKGFVYWDELDEELKGRAKTAVDRATKLFRSTSTATAPISATKPTTLPPPPKIASTIAPAMTPPPAAPMSTSVSPSLTNNDPNMVDYKQLREMLMGAR